MLETAAKEITSETSEMADAKKGQGDGDGRDWRETLFLPRTAFPMKAGLPKREPELLARWEALRTELQCTR